MYVLSPEQQAWQDQEQLRLLEIFHYVMGVVVALCGCMGIFHLIIGITALTNPQALGTAKSGSLPSEFGLMFALVGAGVILFGWILGALAVYAGKCIKRRKCYTFVLVIAGIECLHTPVGTALGVFTFIVMNRPSVRALFGQPVGPQMPQPVPPPESGGSKESNS